jgi:hypothetical protein
LACRKSGDSPAPSDNRWDVVRCLGGAGWVGCASRCCRCCPPPTSPRLARRPAWWTVRTVGGVRVRAGHVRVRDRRRGRSPAGRGAAGGHRYRLGRGGRGRVRDRACHPVAVEGRLRRRRGGRAHSGQVRAEAPDEAHRRGGGPNPGAGRRWADADGDRRRGQGEHRNGAGRAGSATGQRWPVGEHTGASTSCPVRASALRARAPAAPAVPEIIAATESATSVSGPGTVVRHGTGRQGTGRRAGGLRVTAPLRGRTCQAAADPAGAGPADLGRLLALDRAKTLRRKLTSNQPAAAAARRCTGRMPPPGRTRSGSATSTSTCPHRTWPATPPPTRTSTGGHRASGSGFVCKPQLSHPRRADATARLAPRRPDWPRRRRSPDYGIRGPMPLVASDVSRRPVP